VAPFGIGKSSTARGGVRQSGTEALQLVIEYVKQETLTPLKGLGRYLVFGIAGSLALCVGLVLLLVALLRALETETGSTFSGDLSWLPYVIVCAAAVLVMGFAAWRITKGPAARRRAEPSRKGGGSRE
jgi:hypothetical protein